MPLSTKIFFIFVILHCIFSCTRCACLAGTYALNSVCTYCPIGKFTSLTTATSCTLSFAGRYCTGTGLNSDVFCVQCDAGTYSTGRGNTDVNSCTLCPGGTYNPYTARSYAEHCSPCQAGKYSTFRGSTRNGTRTLYHSYRPPLFRLPLQ